VSWLPSFLAVDAVLAVAAWLPAVLAAVYGARVLRVLYVLYRLFRDVRSRGLEQLTAILLVNLKPVSHGLGVRPTQIVLLAEDVLTLH